jgi:hypothetical protein
MKNKTIKNSLCFKLLITLAIFLAFFVPFFVVYAQSGADSAMDGLNKSANKGFGFSGLITDMPTTVGKVIGIALSFVGVLFLILLIYAGFTWMLARGNQQDVTKAKDLMEAAVIGLIIVLGAYAITSYIGTILSSQI